MRIGVLGTGVVGQTIGTALARRGHSIRLGSRTANNTKARDWVASNGERASQGTFADAATFAELVFNCTSGTASLEALHSAGTGNLAGKVLVDVANPLDFSHGMPPTLSICNTDSLAERIQAEFPATKVVKALNTMTAQVMVEPSLVPGEHDVFLSGNDPQAKAQVRELLQEFGWRNIIDLGDITTARGTEMVLPIWLRLWGAFKTPMINFHIAHQ
ncbi:MAG TPA: NAD(P)-binding domain-containing protein [Gemmatimonadaceae bacterium]|nr:NAD(P)-binding domain-containing protein [Gemmatimonadaceae bacterium]